MVTSIIPGATGANPLGVDARFARQQPNGAARGAESAVLGDRVEVSAASIAAARESVREGLNQVHQALAVGHDAQAMLVAARGAASQADLDAVLGAYQQRVDGAIAQGAALIAGQDLHIYAEPGGAPVTISGADLRLKSDPVITDIIGVSSEAQLDDQATGQAVQRSLETLQDSMNRLIDSARALEAHQGFLGAAEGALGVRNDLDAESARLLALQVRQGLQSIGGAPIANAEPQAVLTLFRA
ncbi:MAG TPA: hypothetical protein VM915_01420 [Verrucomicrobiae bacterium]|nr:hypothetical protein [Verrucomicrobiae bacterium]